MYTITVIIPTYKRIKDIQECLDSILMQTVLPYEVLVIDNENSLETEKVVKATYLKFETLNILLKYINNTIENSLTVARNLGVRNSTGNIISFLDDDVILYPEYYQEIIKVFKMYPDALAVSGYPVIKLKKYEKAALYSLNIPAMFFYQNYYKKNKFKLLPSLGVTMPYPRKNIKSIIPNCQWLSGASAYKREIFNEFTYDENLKKYSWGEDSDISYRIYKKYSVSLFFNLNAKYIHKASSTGRASNREIAYMEEVYYLYLFFKLFRQNIKNKLIYIWGRIGRIFFKLLFIFHPRRPFKFVEIIYSIKAYFYCLKHLKEIKNGDLDFFNKTLKK